MRILGFTRCTHHHGFYGGMPGQSKALYEGLAAMGHNVECITTSADKPHDTLFEHGVTYHFLDAPSSIYSERWFQLIVDFFKQAGKIDIVHSTSAAAQHICTVTDRKAPVVATWHGTSYEAEIDKMQDYSLLQCKSLKPEHFYRSLVKVGKLSFQYRQFDHHVAICESAGFLLQALGVDSQRITIIPNPVTLNFLPCSENLKSKSFFNLTQDKINHRMIGKWLNL